MQRAKGMVTSKSGQTMKGRLGRLVRFVKECAAYQSYPKRFDPTTNIRFDLKSDAKVMLEI